MDPIVCRSCGKHVAPVRRRAPRADLENVRTLFDFGWFCPVEQCGVRLDREVATQSTGELESDSEISAEDLLEGLMPKAEDVDEPKRPARVRQREFPKEDLFDRIEREYGEMLREEQQLMARLEVVIGRREVLERFVALMQSRAPIAAE